MINNVNEKIKNYFSSGDERSRLAKKNIFLSLMLKGFSIAIGLILVPMTIKYVNPVQYGVWLTLSSIISWFSFFDIGLGNGLKNKIAETNALQQFEQARIYNSTTYAILSIVSICIFIVFFISNQFINWAAILNVSGNAVVGLNSIALILFAFFCIQFIVQIFNIVLTANHAPGTVALISFIGQAISLFIIYLLTLKSSGSLLNLILVLAGLPLMVQIGASIWYYRHDYKKFAPSLKLVDFKYAKSLLNIGGVFFVIQIGALVLFQTDNIVVTQLFGPKQVTVFNVAYKLFSVITMGFTVMMTPFWSAFTDAYVKQDFDWIKKVKNKIRKILFLIAFFSLLLLFLSPFIYKIWLHGSVEIPWSLSVSMAFYVIVYCWQTSNVFLLNGIGKIRLQLYLVIGSSVINIPIAIFLGNRIGLAGVTLSNSILFLLMGWLFSIQTKKILNNTARGILLK